ncbi:MAG: hypothetical protein AABZ61_05070, partial [Bacteroidota bacterium]
NPRLRRPVLYPIELSAQNLISNLLNFCYFLNSLTYILLYASTPRADGLKNRRQVARSAE